MTVMTDGILLAAIQSGSRCCGPTTRSSSTRPTSAVAQHRLPARLPRPAAPPPPRPQAGDHLRDHRPRCASRRTSATRRSSRSRAGPSPSRRATAPLAGRRGPDHRASATRWWSSSPRPVRRVGLSHARARAAPVRRTSSSSCSGEREIRDTADALAELDLPETETPAAVRAPRERRSSASVFQPHRGRRIVLATNVAETSLTVPGIRYVDRPGDGAHLPLQQHG